MKASVGILLCALLIVGCGKSPDDVEMKNASVADVQKAAAKVETITPGQWTVTTEITEVRLPGVAGEDPRIAEAMTQQMKGRTQTQTSCVTPEQARGPSSALIGGDTNGACSFETFSLLRGRLNAVMTCRKKGDPGQMVIATNGTYAGDTVELESVMRVEQTLNQPKEEAMRLAAKVTGRRTGDCPASKEATK